MVKIEPELLELPEPLDVPLLEPLELLELLELLPLDVLLDDELVALTDAGVAPAVCVSPHVPAKTPMVAAATPARSVRLAAIRAAGARRAPPAEAACAAAT